MKNIQIATILCFLLFSSIGCHFSSKTEKSQKESFSNNDSIKVQEWLSSGKWNDSSVIYPDSTINFPELNARYLQNKERWENAFTFLLTQNLKELKKGRYELDGDSLFVIVDEYAPREEEKTRYEVHQKYADIQYVAQGEEKISIIPFADTEKLTDYDNEKDIMFLKAKKDQYRLATPESFFVFFPDDAHRPSVATESSSFVKKIVIKVKL